MFIDGIIHLVKYKLLERDKIFVDPMFGDAARPPKRLFDKF